MEQLWALAVAVLAVAHGDELLVDTTYGPIQGQYIADIRAFRAIPYATPPVGSLRWSPPVPPAAWTDTYMAARDPPGCPQNCDLPPLTCPQEQDEDCLYLNVFAPSDEDETAKEEQEKRGAQLRPVLVFIHGGNFKQGYGGGLLYNATHFVQHTGAVVVTINYRLGALGFLWSIGGPAGNYGFKDQQLALQWVRDNAAAFGGDPDAITIFGQSAGAVSVALHLQTHSHNFRYALLESEPFGLPIRDTATWGVLPENFFHFLGCDDYDPLSHDNAEFWQCLRGKTIKEIIHAQTETENNVINEGPNHWLDLFMPWTPTVGTDLFAEQPLWAFQRGAYSDAPMVIGTVHDEGNEFIWGAFPNPLPRGELIEVMTILIGPEITEGVLRQYPLPTNTSDYRLYLSRVTTDGVFRCPTRNATASRFGNGFQEAAFVYHFDTVSSFNLQAWGANYSECVDVVCHAAELPYVFHPNLQPINASFSQSEHQLAVAIQSYWASFADTGKPGASEMNVDWGVFESGSEETLLLQAGNVQVIEELDYDAAKCAFWDTTDYAWIR